MAGARHRGQVTDRKGTGTRAGFFIETAAVIRHDGGVRYARANYTVVAEIGEAHVSGIASKLTLGVLTGGVVASLVCAGATLCPAYGADSAKVPNFAPDSSTGWLAQDDEFIPPPSGPGPITFDPAHPYISFYKFPRNPRPSFPVADLTNPILQPWTREHLRKVNERSLSGKVVAIPKERCWPVGVPTFLVLPATPVYFLQTPKDA